MAVVETNNRAPLALLALAMSAFAIGTTEFVIVGLLPDVAVDLSVSIPSAGLLVSGYALGVVIGAPTLTAVATRLPRKQVLLALMMLFTVGNALCALAASYDLLMAGRVVAALSHGAFFGVGSIVAADLVAPDKRAGAIAMMFTGLTVANVLGVPMGTLLGQQFGWRSTFWVITVLGIAGLVGIARLVPVQPRAVDGALRRELAAFRHPRLWLALATTALGFGGLFASFTYIAPMMTQVAHFAPAGVTWLLVLFGGGLVAGNILGGKAADRALMPTLLVTLAALTVMLAVFTVTAHDKFALTLTVLGVVGFGTVPALQIRVLQQAGAANAFASAANIAAFNLGNAFGAYLGGLTISAGLGYTSPNWVGATLAAAGLGVALVAAALPRSETREVGASAGSALCQPLPVGSRSRITEFAAGGRRSCGERGGRALDA